MNSSTRKDCYRLFNTIFRDIFSSFGHHEIRIIISIYGVFPIFSPTKQLNTRFNITFVVCLSIQENFNPRGVRLIFASHERKFLTSGLWFGIRVSSYFILLSIVTGCLRNSSWAVSSRNTGRNKRFLVIQHLTFEPGFSHCVVGSHQRQLHFLYISCAWVFATTFSSPWAFNQSVVKSPIERSFEFNLKLAFVFQCSWVLTTTEY